MKGSERMVEVKHLKKYYRMGDETIKALDDVTFTVNRGEFVAIIGPSGSGKSTLMNMIGCLDTPDAGEYFLEGMDVFQCKNRELAKIRNEKIGFIFQNFNLLSRDTAFENVELPLIYKGIRGKQRKEMVMEALKKVGLENRAKHRPAELSGGQQQRVAIARAIVCNPPLLLADEPTGSLDTKTGKEMIELLKQLNREGHTIILITHDLNIAGEAGRILHIRDGRLAEEKEAVIP
ncbi:ABC transporter ATP-binding protein [Caldibacillus debilis]|uniref:ABC transporter ATP-binding protein n=1 Tax=Caldibacillus debilis TaxID=301148 RepID=UPI0023F25BB6|nr:ABC transporter ATP-binding protein [Caldibacillus debilis]